MTIRAAFWREQPTAAKWIGLQRSMGCGCGGKYAGAVRLARQFELVDFVLGLGRLATPPPMPAQRPGPLGPFTPWKLRRRRTCCAPLNLRYRPLGRPEVGASGTPRVVPSRPARQPGGDA
jgi:hypothetical protein